MKDPRDTITIPRKLAFRLLGELETLTELCDDKSRGAHQIITDGDMHDSYYKLRAAIWPPIKDKFKND
jgi:hypothetical protein